MEEKEKIKKGTVEKKKVPPPFEENKPEVEDIPPTTETPAVKYSQTNQPHEAADIGQTERGSTH